MPRGFGRLQSKRQASSQRTLKEVQQMGDREPSTKPQTEAEVCLMQQAQLRPEELTLAWQIGIYNPLAGMEHPHARLLTPKEEEWLLLAAAVGWLTVRDGMDAIYFTAPPPEFSLEQADWYVRPDLTTVLEEPERLKEVVQDYPISTQWVHAMIDQEFTRLEWSSTQIAAFVLEQFEQPKVALTKDELIWLLLELQQLN